MVAMTSYKIARLHGLHQNVAINKVYADNPDLINETYKAQHDVFTRENLSCPTGFSASMNELGNKSIEIYYDCRNIQIRWAMENGFQYDDQNWQTDILLHQLRKFSPDVLFFQDIFSLPREMRINIKHLVPSVKLTIINKGYPGEREDLSDCDILIVSSPILVERYKHCRPHLVYHSFDHSILGYLSQNQRRVENESIGFYFVGSVRPLERRYWMIRELFERTDLKMWGYENKVERVVVDNPPIRKRYRLVFRLWVRKILMALYGIGLGVPVLKCSKYLPKKMENVIYDVDESLKEHNKEILYGIEEGESIDKTLAEMYPDRWHDSVWGLEYYQKLQDLDVLFNMHSQAAKNTVDNMRLFETTGVGSCLLTDTGVNMGDIFEEDKEIVTYRSIDEAVEKIDYLINHPDKVSEIAKAGQARTLRDHTIMNRCQQIDEIIQHRLLRI